MNTLASQVSIFSGPPDDGPTRAGHGPNLYEWMQTQPDAAAHCTLFDNGANTFAPRQIYGEYLCEALDAIVRHFPTPHRLQPLLGRVDDAIWNTDASFQLTLGDGRANVHADVVILATGHSTSTPSLNELQRLHAAKSSPACEYTKGDAAADFDLDNIRAGEPVGVIGLGLGFHDVVAALTTGRGGRFIEEGDQLVYVASGREPKIVAGSRSGLPIPARGLNQKAIGATYAAVFFTREAVAAVHGIEEASHNRSQLSFNRHLRPLILAELEHVYYTTWLRQTAGEEAAQRFAQEHIERRAPQQPIPADLVASFGLKSVAPLDLEKRARPFAGAKYNSAEDFRQAWRAYLELDLREARLSNLGSPLKAALDVLRDVRDTLRSAVEFDSLDEHSLQIEFRDQFAPLCGLLAAGPPATRICQLLALDRAGVISIVGPDMEVTYDAAEDCFVLHSPYVGRQDYSVRRLIDSRVPFPSLSQNCNPLLQSMQKRGLICAYQHNERKGLLTGGIDILPDSFEAVSDGGRAHTNLFAIGLPTESPRWFTQVGSATPGVVSRFTEDAIAVARGALASVPRVYESDNALEESAK